jgi:hypothetical protein
MSRYTNQAKRVMDHVSAVMGMNEEALSRIFGFIIPVFENRIELITTISKKNAKQAAGFLIEVFDKSTPISEKYKESFIYNGITFKYRIVDNKEIILLFTTEHGDDLISLPLTGETLEHCAEQSLALHNEKVKRLR